MLGIAKPEYLFRPHQIVRKAWAEFLGRKPELKKAHLPWGLDIALNAGEAIGWSIYTRGLYETAVTECLWRLALRGRSVVDVGANIGYMSSVLAVKVGPSGKVYAFEPHPAVFETLQMNAVSWSNDGRCGQIVLHQAALGNRKGLNKLYVPNHFSKNEGTSWTGAMDSPSNDHSIDITVLVLDEIIPHQELIEVVKIDVEGYELSVLKGMERLLQERRVRHIVFEEEGAFPAATHAFLSTFGYTIYGIEQRFRGVRLFRNGKPHVDPLNGPAPNFLATLASDEQVRSLVEGFWESFGPVHFWKAYSGGSTSPRYPGTLLYQ